MGTQPSLFDEEPRTDGLFYALFPRAAAATVAGEIAAQQRVKHGLTGWPLARERLHVSLLGFGAYAGLPPGLVTRAIHAAATLTTESFDVTFDRAMSFLGKPRPLVLCGGEGASQVIAFQQALGAATRRVGLGAARQPYMPHVTLLYDVRGIAEEAVEPVSWAVTEFVLVHSLIGRCRYLPLGRWPLRG